MITGSVIDVADKKIVVAQAMLAPQVTEADVKSEAPSSVSPMPAGLLNEFTKEQIVVFPPTSIENVEGASAITTWS